MIIRSYFSILMEEKFLVPMLNNDSWSAWLTDYEPLRWHFRQAVRTNMRCTGEPVLEHDFPSGSDSMGEILRGPKAAERMEFGLDSRLAVDINTTYDDYLWVLRHLLLPKATFGRTVWNDEIVLRLPRRFNRSSSRTSKQRRDLWQVIHRVYTTELIVSLRNFESTPESPIRHLGWRLRMRGRIRGTLIEYQGAHMFSVDSIV